MTACRTVLLISVLGRVIMHCNVLSTKSGHRFLQGRRIVCSHRCVTPHRSFHAYALFGFGKKSLRTDSESAGMIGSQGRSDYGYDDVEQYFNYMGMLADDGDYTRMKRYLDAKIDYIDIILLWASTEGDDPKVEELLKAGAHVDVTDMNGKTPMDLAGNDRVKELLLQYSSERND